jgi:uncharacterized linocin/CFP29 family protein
MDPLRRASAPLSDRAWKEIDDAVARAARHVMTARRVADFRGPRGWDYIAARLGTTTACQPSQGRVGVCVPDIAPLAELRSDFRLPWVAIESFERGAPALETRDAEGAAREVALAEDRLLLYGDPVGQGFLNGPGAVRVTAHDWAKAEQVVNDVLAAVEALDGAGVGGPYELALSPGRYYQYLQAVENGGYPTQRHLKDVVQTVHRSVVMKEVGALFSTRGGDFCITVGGDLSVGYRGDDIEAVHLFCLETIVGQVITPEAVCVLSV